MTPTIADVLGVPLGYRADGQLGLLARGAAAARGEPRHARLQLDRPHLRPRWEARRRQVVAAQAARVRVRGRRPVHRHRSSPRAARPASIRACPRGCGRRRARHGGRRRELTQRAARLGGLVPAQIAGDVRGGRAGARRDLAVAVNGRIEAVGRTFHLTGDPREHYSLMVPEATLREGRNSVEVFEVSGRRDAAAARPRLSHSSRLVYISSGARMGPARGRARPLALISACGGGDEAPATPHREPPVVVLDLRRVPGGHAAAARRQHRRRALSPTSPTSRPISTWFPNAHTVYDSTFKAVPAIQDAALPRTRDGGRTAAATSRASTTFRPAGLRDARRGVRRGALPAAHLPGRADPAARGAGPAGGGGRPARLHKLDRGDPQARPARPSTSSTRCCRTSPGSTCPRARRRGPKGERPDTGDQPADRLPRPGPHQPQREPPPPPGGLRGPSGGPAARPPAAHRAARRARSSWSPRTTATRSSRREGPAARDRRNMDEVAPVAAVREGARPDRGRGEPTAWCATSTSCPRWPTCWTHASRGSTTGAPPSRRQPRARGRSASSHATSARRSGSAGRDAAPPAANRRRRARAFVTGNRASWSSARPVGGALPRGAASGADRTRRVAACRPAGGSASERSRPTRRCRGR